MRLFISAGEPSGDLHGGNLVRSLRELHPGIECSGFGGEHMTEAGCELLYPLAQEAVLGIWSVLGSVPFYFNRVKQADHYFRTKRPEAVVLIDYPGFHWWLAQCARDRRIPVYYFVPPQIWAWAQWRVRKMRRLVNHVICTLPFEKAWYDKHHVPASYVGHPYFDELHQQRLDGGFMSAQRARPGTIVGLLPGSRGVELDLNVSSLLRAAQIIHTRRPHVRFLVACLKPSHEREVKAKARGMQVPIEVHSGRTPEIIQLAHSVISVSGSVSLELLFRGKPAVVMYRQYALNLFMAQFLKKTRFISLVNLLADKELYPEFLSHACKAEEMAAHVLHWLDHREAYEALKGELKKLCDRLAVPGACERGAREILEMAGSRSLTRQLAA
jgi:lipid-A-disaccharide synthase